MAGWNPQRVLAEPGLRLSEVQKAAILSQLPRQPNGEIYADAIFEGGGVKGTAFLGSLRCCNDLGITWRKLAGTSAGAITASLAAANLPIDDLERVLGELDYMEFLTQKTSPLIFNGKPDNDLESPLRMMLNLTLARRPGQYSSDPFKAWMQKVLAQGNLQTFSDIPAERALKVVVSDITRGEMLVLPDALQDPLLLKQLGLNRPEDFNIAEAVRLSMSIPFFFAPGKLGNSFIVDGGILSNFPLWIYDVNFKPGEPNRLPRWPTFGFRLVEQESRPASKVNGPFDIFAAMIKTMMAAKDRYYLRNLDQGRVVNIDLSKIKVSATQFNLSNDKKDQLYRLGYESTKNFFLNTWSWEKHLISRGFEPAATV